MRDVVGMEGKTIRRAGLKVDSFVDREEQGLMEEREVVLDRVFFASVIVLSPVIVGLHP